MSNNSSNTAPRRFRAATIYEGTVQQRLYESGDVIVIREGPKGNPGMREMSGITALLYGQSMGDKVALLTYGRFSGATRACASARQARKPPTADPSPLCVMAASSGLTPARSISVKLTDAEIAARLAAMGKTPAIHLGSLLEKYALTARPGDQGAVTHSGAVVWLQGES